jgi:hypothetical protein
MMVVKAFQAISHGRKEIIPAPNRDRSEAVRVYDRKPSDRKKWTDVGEEGG